MKQWYALYVCLYSYVRIVEKEFILGPDQYKDVFLPVLEISLWR